MRRKKKIERDEKENINKYIKGKTTDGKIVVSGLPIFKLVDTFGYPLDIIDLELSDNNCIFDLYEFIYCALKSKNFTVRKLLNILSVLSYFDKYRFSMFIDYVNKFKNKIV